ncbi:MULTISPECIES: LAETG motif-containing sortase-dependent surface protein [unclassified Streptomyces]|uniref:LAETG motif-containing sortase-dependent surface protein n=1 Tax=unclassified Streptomyces TaxID=2593676 RepID=UPI000DC49C9C|nr:LAETG motif-containing sortase-dependent surface protein [Streptomyces sp. PsTaAH-137]MYT74599.1 LPXTG cell wall anchor domain-containing protein [Streptomyces sp. SID8367]RAJ91583.1 LPXTG-motif cell wall-anchored protein [Streptomyces sp. PsTaAH-137]
MNHLVPVRGAVVAAGLLAALATVPAAHATETPSPAGPATAATVAPSPVPSKPATSAPSPATSVPQTVEPSAAPARPKDATPSAAPGGTEAPSPVPSKDELAHTGSSNTGTTVMGAGAVVLVAGGAGALFAVRRRSHR